MSNSPLSCMRKISPMQSGKRSHAIDTITIHCVVGQVSVEWLCDFFYGSGKEASCNYGVGLDGRICTIVDEDCHSWCSSDWDNDDRAVTMECASNSYHPYAINSKVYDSIIALCTDICKRNGKDTLLWFGNKDKTLAYKPKKNEMVMTVHRWFDDKSCPGDYIYNRLTQIAATVTMNLKGDDDMLSYEDFKKYMQKYETEVSKQGVSKWAKESWDKAVESKVFDGTNPRGSLTREQAAAVLDRVGVLNKE